MNFRPFVRRGLLAGSLLFLLYLAWQTLSGGFRQLPRSHSLGQKVETVVQLDCGVLSLLVALTCFWRRSSAGLVRTLWSICLAGAAGLSALVWGPPMPGVAVLFVTMALLVARTTKGALRTALSA